VSCEARQPVERDQQRQSGQEPASGGQRQRQAGRRIVVPGLALVLLIGPSGSGKSTFARRHFRLTEVLSSDFFRALVSDDEADQTASRDAFEVLHLVVEKRLWRGRLTVVDATNTTAEARSRLLELAQRYHVPAVAIVFDLPLEAYLERDAQRPGRRVGQEVIVRQFHQLQMNRRRIREEPFTHRYWLRSIEEIDQAVVERRPLPCDKRAWHGPLDIVGDVHGCFAELCDLLGVLGYRVERLVKASGEPGFRVYHPKGRRLVFIGDLVDRGPDSPSVLRLAMDAVGRGRALCVLGNHDRKLMRYLEGQEVKIAHGLEKTLEQMASEPEPFRRRVLRFLQRLSSHYVLDSGRLVVAHAGLPQEYHGRCSPTVRRIALFGVTTGQRDERGLPVRVNWALSYRGRALVVYGHTPVQEAIWINRTINIDTGCVFGNKLTALRYPELELVSVPAREMYYPAPRSLLTPEDLQRPLLVPAADEMLPEEVAADGR
jgi:protein phosphatase